MVKQEKKENGASDPNAPQGQAAQQPPQGFQYYPGYGYYPQKYPYYIPPAPRTQRSEKPKIAGALLIVAAMLGMIFSVFMVGMPMFFENIEDAPHMSGELTSIGGTITDETNAPLPNVTVTILDTGMFVRTDANGTYRMNGVPVGYHQIRYEKTGYNTIMYGKTVGFDIDYAEHGPGSWRSIDDTENTFDFTMTPGASTVELGETKDVHDEFPGPFRTIMTSLGVLTLVFSVVALVGGIMALRREHYGLAVVGSILGIFSIGFILGAVLALIALFILLLSSKEFKRKENGYQ